jgi:alkylation response protein AidB-like acyl-CoA dehydrogenase
VIELSDDERTELRETARRLLLDRSSSLQVRALLDDARGYDAELWASMGDLGWPAIHIPDRFGGTGASYTDLAVVLHELGRQVTSSPMLASAVVGAAALVSAPNDALAAELLPGVASGATLLAPALSSAGGSYEPSQLSVHWSSNHGSVTLDGVARFVPDAHLAGYIVVAATDDAGAVTLAVVDGTAGGITVVVEPTFDQTRRLATMTFDGVRVEADRLLADPGTGTALYERLVSVGAIATVCDAVGCAEQMLEISNTYAKQRIQFGRPIGSFQAVKHHLANMLTDVEASRAAATFAVDSLDRGGDVRHAAAVAKSFAGPACSRVAGLAIQVHGGIGFTWEHDAHLYLKRVRLDEALFGTAKWHRQHLAGMLIDAELTI